MLASLRDLSGGIRSLSGHVALLDAFMRFAAMYLVFVGVLVLVPIWFRRDGLLTWLAAGLGALLAIGLSAGTGALWDRPRPFVARHFVPLIAHGNDASFPSDHLAVLGCGGVVPVVRLAVMLGISALVVAFARVFVGVRYVTDVADGFILGLACGGLTSWATGRALPAIRRIDRFLVRCRLRPASATASAALEVQDS